jgi:drug/metabolite transporter (DMT)-like permease
VDAPRPADYAALAIAIAGVSTSGPLMAGLAAPALAVAFWRNAMAEVVLVPIVLARGGSGRRELGLTALAGLVLAGHFATWIPSVRLTTVAASTALVSTIPIWTALIQRAGGQRVTRRTWVGTALALAGVVVVTGVDVTGSTRAVAGDLLALAGGVLAAVYVLLGGRIRRTVDTTTYAATCYAVCAAVMLAVCVTVHLPLTGYSGLTWLGLAALTVAAQLLGHSLVNHVLRRIPVTVVSVAILAEVPGAALLAGVFLGQRPPAATLPGLLLILAGLVTTVRGRRNAEPVIAPD